jgi:hypothetical protein
MCSEVHLHHRLIHRRPAPDDIVTSSSSTSTLPPQTNGVAGRLACCPDVVVINRDAAGAPDGSSLKLTDLLHCAGCVRSNSSSWH